MIAGQRAAVNGRLDSGTPALLAANRWLSMFERSFAVVAAGSILFMMAVIVADVGGRYLFNRPLAWAYDIVSIYLLPLMVYLAIADAYRRNQHISVDLLYNLMDLPRKRLVRLVATIVVVIAMVPITWLATGEAVSRYRNDVVIAGSILWPTWIPAFFLAVGGALLILRAMLDGIALFMALLRGGATVPGESEERQQDVDNQGDAT